ncbi:MAG: hypothetical protein WC505_05770 [Patescibacteria group bacterium]
MTLRPGYSGRGRPPKYLSQRSDLTPESTDGGSKSGETTPSPGKQRRAKSSRYSRLDKRALVASSPNVNLSGGSVALTAQQLGSEPQTGNPPSVTTYTIAPNQNPNTLSFKLSESLLRVLPENCGVLKHEPEAAAWFIHNGSAGLLIEWHAESGSYGSYSIRLVGIENEKPVIRKINEKDHVLEFYGEIAVKGSGNNDLFASFGPDDADQRDQEGTVVNKPRSVVISPKRVD